MITKRRPTSPATRRSTRAKGDMRSRIHIILPNAAILLLERIADAQEAWIAHGRSESAKMDARVVKIDAERDEERARHQAMADDQARRFGTLPRAPHPLAPPHGHRFPPEFFAGRRFCIVCGMEDHAMPEETAPPMPTPPRSPLRSV